MNFFKKDILKVKSKVGEDGVSFYINYFKLKRLDDFKILLLKEMLGNNKCLAIINTEMKYYKDSKNNKKESDELTGVFDKVGIKYKKIEFKKTQDLVILGAVIKSNDKGSYKEYIIGFIIEAEKLESITSIINNYNINYYVNYSQCSDDELLCEFQSKYNDEEELRASNNLNIFNDNFVKSITIHSQSKDYQFVMDNISKVKESFSQ